VNSPSPLAFPLGQKVRCPVSEDIYWCGQISYVRLSWESVGPGAYMVTSFGEGRGGEARGGARGWPTSNRPFWAQKYHASRVCCFLLRVKSLRQIFYLHWVAFTDCKSSSGISNADTSISLVLCSCPFLRSCFSTLQQRFKVLFLFPLPCKLRLQNCSSYYVASRGGINYWHIGTIEAFQVWHWGAQ
jgi:hypothetical protein